MKNDSMQLYASVDGGPVEPIKWYDDGGHIEQDALISSLEKCYASTPTISFNPAPRFSKKLRAAVLGYARPSGIKRTRKRLARKAVQMMTRARK